MNQEEYGLYLLGLIEEEPYGENGVTEDDLFGYFQSFMPGGTGVEKVFEPLENGKELLKRIRPVYDMLDPADFEGEAVPGYFNGGRQDAAKERLEELGRELIGGLRRIFAMAPELAEEADRVLADIAEVEVLKPGAVAPILGDFEAEDDEGSLIYETLSDLIAEHTDYEEAPAILSEAYYSIGCDYWLSYYLQWPRYRGLQSAGDPLRAYAELYILGYHVVFQQAKLLIGRR
ncbi:hypothetical protein [Saccharibacillus alkalitolerans]|uniref:Uncharacterized protein n=1 Tax=Saccharibacillus alkalitolerans TaxID=2705290 RepID=A0ABX0F369_9BACL|nr:hypothetical protein [Saccharibacillus alkalitolerans]NGZ74389.1 hypothetical protein [Saccharibacillus alkalitolerans]